MRICIHRGTAEVGGSCVELESDGQRLVIDLGMPLDAGRADAIELPNIAGLDGDDATLLGVLISHGHPDHWGLAPLISPAVPIFVGQITARILAEAKYFTPMGATFSPSGLLRDREPLQVGPFAITPYLIDHSAFDAYALQVDAGGRRLIYSGDFRVHGRRRALVEALIADPPDGVDVLLLEGTHVRDQPVASADTEQDVEDHCAERFAATEGMALVAYSPQNVDRMITLYRAAQRAGRTLVLDLYAASVAAACDDPDVPQPDWPDVAVYVPQAQRIKVKRTAEFERVNALRGHRIFNEELAPRADELVMPFRASMTAELEQAECLQGASATWSMWSGYLDRDTSGLGDWLVRLGISLEVIHASGHAHVSDLQRVAASLNARQVVPIHTGAAHRFGGLFDGVVVRHDGEWWDA